MTQTVGKKSAVYGVGVYGYKIYGEDYAPLTVVIGNAPEIEPSTAVVESTNTTIQHTVTSPLTIVDTPKTSIYHTVTESTGVSDSGSSSEGTSGMDIVSISESVLTEIAHIVTEGVGYFEEEASDLRIDEIIHVIETVLCELSCSTTELLSITEVPTTCYEVEFTDTCGYTESLETLYDLTIDEIIHIIETEASYGSVKYKCAVIDCDMDYPKYVYVYCPFSCSILY